MIVPLPAGGSVRLRDVAQVELAVQEPEAVAKVGDTACVILQVSKRSGGNEMAISNAIVDRMDELSAENASIHYTAPYLASDYISQAVTSALQNILQGVISGSRCGVFVPAPGRGYGDHRRIDAHLYFIGIPADAGPRPVYEYDEPGRHCHGRRHDRGQLDRCAGKYLPFFRRWARPHERLY